MNYKAIIKSRNLRLKLLRMLTFIPNGMMLRIQYFIKQGKRLDLKNPKLFTEKIQWLKLHDRNECYHAMVDKVRAKEYVAKIIGEQYIVPTYGVWDSVDEVDFASLPEQFVLKTNTGGGNLNVVICKSKANLNMDVVRKKLAIKGGRYTTRSSGREWPYEGIRKCVFAEAYLQNKDDAELTDYKFYCFNGEPMYCQVIGNRSTGETIDFYDRDWVRQEFIGLNPDTVHAAKPAAKPENLLEMQDIARKLSVGRPFLRVDLYNVNGKVYFSELTFYPASGYGFFNPLEWDRKLGDLIKLPGKDL